MERGDEEIDPFVLRVRGLPWSASKDDVVKFFENCKIKDDVNGVHMTMSREGRPSGEAYVEFETEADADKGADKNKENLGSRYIEVFRAKPNEMSWALERCGVEGDEPMDGACVRLRGLPFGCSKEEIAQFFTGLEIVRNGITLPTDFNGRSTGEAYVQFASQEVAEKAMGKHKEKIGHRYIEIFKSSMQEIRSSMGMGGPMRMGRGMSSGNRSGPYDRPGGFNRGGRGGGRGRGGSGGGSFSGGFPDRAGVRDTGHSIHMRGLPFKAIEKDIFEFFAPVKPVAVRIKYEASGRPSGEADAMFGNHGDALRAMEKDKEKIQHRYIELFLESMPDSYTSGMGYGSRSDQFGAGRNFMSESDGGFDNGDRGFGPSRGYGGGQDSGYRGGSSGSGPSRSFGMGGGRSDNDFRFAEDKPFSQGFGSGMGDRGFQGNPSDPRGYGRGGGNAMGRSFGNSDAGYGSSTGDRFNSPGFGMTDSYRNGSGNMQGSGSMPGRADGGFGANQSNDSDFYGSGKLFGNSNYQASSGQGMNMPTSYPGF